MRSAIEIACRAVAVAVIGFGAVTAVVPAIAYSEPSPSDPSSDPGSEEEGYGDGSDYQPTVPTFNRPTSTISAQTIERRRPNTPDNPPPVDIPRVPVDIPRIPVDIPRVPVDIPRPSVEIPVIPAPPPPAVVPVDAPLPPPVQLPVVPPPPAAPPLPSPRVLLTSHAEPGTQALTIIVVFLVAGAWIYAHRIASHWTTGRKTSASTTQ